MDATQRRTIALAAYAIAAVMFVFFFGRQFWQWANWHDARGTLDFGLFKISSRPPFPNDARSVLLGLILPIVLAAGGRVIGSAGPAAPRA
jgi:hypothetical protein